MQPTTVYGALSTSPFPLKWAGCFVWLSLITLNNKDEECVDGERDQGEPSLFYCLEARTPSGALQAPTAKQANPFLICWLLVLRRCGSAHSPSEVPPPNRPTLSPIPSQFPLLLPPPPAFPLLTSPNPILFCLRRANPPPLLPRPSSLTRMRSIALRAGCR